VTDDAKPSPVDLVAMGETMVLFQTLQDGPIRFAPLFAKSIAGAESNVALAMRRLGRSSRWVSRLGTDPFGDFIAATLAGEGVEVSFIIRDRQAPTALFFREFQGYGEPSAYYYRARSAASRLSPEDVTADWLEGAKVLHVTGITPALSDSAREATFAAMRLARELGILVSFDPNLRRKLWPEETAHRVLNEMVPLCDLFLPGLDEAEFLSGRCGADECGAYFLSQGPRLVVLKMGNRGSVGFAEGRRIERPAFPVEKIVDPIGAGDAFAAGFLSVLLERRELELGAISDAWFAIALERGNLMGALATQFKGDWESLPTLDEANRIAEGAARITR
jgi:2-dehydro-3-deoxygluconokinase